MQHRKEIVEVTSNRSCDGVLYRASTSSAMYFPENKISGYTTKLSQEVVSEGEWECGLAEVHYPLYYNAINNEFAIRKSMSEPSMQKQLSHLTIHNGHYRKGDIADLVYEFIADTDVKITTASSPATRRQAM